MNSMSNISRCSAQFVPLNTMLSRLSIHALGLLSVSGLGWAAATSMSADTRMHCSSLLNTTLTGNVSILETTFHEAHTVNSTSGSTQIYNTYSFCRVSGAIAYGHNSSLNFLVYLPEVDTYNGRFMAVGNGGMAGVVDDFAMMQQLNTGFAVAGGDAGHLAARNNGGSGAPDTYIPYLHDKDQVEAWIHNAISLFVPASKALIANYYNKRPRYSYYIGCSTGGAQGFALAQYHPELFDGIIAGCPGNWYSHLALSFLWNSQKAPVNTSSYLNQATLNTLQAAALQACDEIDGVKDGVIENPLLCKFDIDTLACTGPKPSNGNSSEAPCLTSTEIAAAKAIYAGPVNSATNRSLYPGFAHGSEGQWILQEGDLSAAFSVPILQNLVFDNLTYDASKFNWDSDVKAVDTNAGALIDAISVNLTAFRDKGSKMLVYQGQVGLSSLSKYLLTAIQMG